MRYTTFLVAVLAALSIGALQASGYASFGTPALSFVAGSPLRVHGAHFRQHERVRVTFNVGSQAPAVVVRTSVAGSFTASAPAGLTSDPCGSPLVISATGVLGDHASLRRPPRLCAPETPSAPALPAG